MPPLLSLVESPQAPCEECSGGHGGIFGATCGLSVKLAGVQNRPGVTPARSVPFLKERLRPAPGADAKQLARLIADLDADAFEKREAASRELARLSPTLKHHCLIAERLLDAGQPDEARHVLDAALREHQYNPANVRWRNWRWASEARRLLRTIDDGRSDGDEKGET